MMSRKKIAILVFLGLITISSFLLLNFGFSGKSINYKSKPPIALKEKVLEEPLTDLTIDNHTKLLFIGGILMGGFFILKKTKMS